MVTRGKHERPEHLSDDLIGLVENELLEKIKEDVRRYVASQTYTISRDGHTFVYDRIDLPDFQITRLTTRYS